MAYTTDSSPCIKIASFNLHGLSQGIGMLLELYASSDVKFCQEHWLSSDQLVKVNNLSRDFHCISISAMDTMCGCGILRGRPFGGLAVLIRNTLSSDWLCLVKSERIVAVRVRKCIFINVYFPVYSGSGVSYHTAVTNILSTLDSVILVTVPWYSSVILTCPLQTDCFVVMRLTSSYNRRTGICVILKVM